MTSDPLPETDLCRLELDGSVANLTMDRTDVFNALNEQIISEMADVREWTAERSVGRPGELLSPDGSQNIRALVSRSEGKHFCAGADINMMADGGGTTPEHDREGGGGRERGCEAGGPRVPSQADSRMCWAMSGAPCLAFQEL